MSLSTARPRAPDLCGRALDGRYELHALIGEGAFGRVYRGRDRRLARAVAVKVIKPWWAEDPDWVLPPSGAADAVLATEVLPDDVQDALRALPADFRAAVVLCDVVGLSYQQISEALGTPLGTVRSRIHRGRALLREALS